MVVSEVLCSGPSPDAVGGRKNTRTLIVFIPAAGTASWIVTVRLKPGYELGGKVI